MSVTGYSDAFTRTIAVGMGSADGTGQTYTLVGAASQFSVDTSAVNIGPTAAGDMFGYIDFQTRDVDISALVSMSGVPANNLTTVGFVAKHASASTYYNGTMMVASTGAISLRFSKVVAGGLSTIATIATGLTYSAFTPYNLRYSIYWSPALQTNVMQLKLWAQNTAQPGGWTATAFDSAITPYTAGTHVGLMGRDESTPVGNMFVYIQSVVASSYSLPMPATTDPMCATPAIAYPKETAVEALAAAVDTVVATFDPLTSLAGVFPRVRISNSGLVLTTSQIFIPLTFSSTEFNVGTSTNLGYDTKALYLPQGIWMVYLEIQLAEAASNYISGFFTGGPAFGQADFEMRSNAAQTNDQGVGGCLHASSLTYCSDPTTPTTIGVTLIPANTATTYTVKYAALSAVKISDYFT